MNKVSLSSHFTYKNIFLQVFSPIIMMIFTSIYGLVDGIFVSNFDSDAAFAGLNLIYPIICIVGGLGFMFGSGGSAYVSKLLGEQKREEANIVFTNILITTLVVGITFSIIGFIFVKPLAIAMGKITDGSTPEMVEKAIQYGRILMCSQSLFMIQNLFQNFFVVDERQDLGFAFTLAAGVTNMIFDALFIAVFKWGIVGAALATILGQCVGSIGPLIYFLTHKNGYISLKKSTYNIRPILKSCTNGLSDFIFNISSSIVAVFYNIQLLKYFGESGVSVYGVLMYINFFFVAIFIGYSIGIAPVISYNFGAKNKKELHNVVQKSLILLFSCSAVMLVLGLTLSNVFSTIFLNGNEELLTLCNHALKIFSISYLFSGISIFITSLFTALNDGLISGINSFLRTFFFQAICIFVIPLAFGGEGIWWSGVIAEFLAIIVGFFFFILGKMRYNY